MADVQATIQKTVILLCLRKSVGPAGVSIFPVNTRHVHEQRNLEKGQLRTVH